MAEIVVVKEPLAPEMLAAGRELTNRLRQLPDFDLVCSLWTYAANRNAWRLIIATTLADKFGPLHVYQVLQGIVRAGDWPTDLEMDLSMVSVMRANHPFTVELRSRVGHFDIHEIPPEPRPSRRQRKSPTFASKTSSSKTPASISSSNFRPVVRDTSLRQLVIQSGTGRCFFFSRSLLRTGRLVQR